MIPREHILKSPPVELTRSVTGSNGMMVSRFNSEHQFMLTCPTGSLPGSRPNFHLVNESYSPPGLYPGCRSDSSRHKYDRSITTFQLRWDNRNKFKSSTSGYLYKKRCHQYEYSTELTLSFEHTERSLNFDSFTTSQVLAEASWQANPSFPSQESR